MNQEFRYPGLASFTTAQRDLFFGRKRETRELFHLLSVEKTVVLFSKSGLGKTSLLNAGVIPLLAENRIWPVPIRFGTEEIEPEWHFKFQFDEAYRKFVKKEGRKTLAENESFWEQIKKNPFQRDGEIWTPLLIFDQFEELFTLYPQPERRARFVQELADLIQERLPERLREALFEQLDAGKISPSAIAEAEKAPPLKIVFSIRSDMLHFMDELSEQIPYILRSRYQLFGLAEEQAREAITAPAALPRGERFISEPFGYTEEALHEIIGTLTKNREVESFQLQAVCQALEEKMLASGGTTQSRATTYVEINPAFYGGTEGIGRILEESYQRRLDSLENSDWITPAARLLEDALVNENGRRRSVDVADLLARPGVTQALLDALEIQRLVRKEPRLDSFYYEISHDTLLAPIVKSRRAREAEEEKARAAAELAEQKRKAELTRRRLLVVRGLLAAAAVAAVALLAAVGLGIKVINSERKAISALRKAESQLAVNKLIAERKLPNNFDLLISLNSLDCSDWNIGFLSSEIGKLVNLRELNLSGNKLTNLPDQIAQLRNLQSLNLRDNNFTRLPPQILLLKNIQLLNVGNNELSSIPSEITELENLYSLGIGNNNLSELPPEIFKLNKLQSLDLGWNKFTSLPHQIIELDNLEMLYVGGLNMGDIPDEIFTLKNLKTLDLGGNKLRSLPSQIGKLKKLESLSLEWNKMMNLPDSIVYLKSLTSLNLARNYLTRLPSQILEMEKLKDLNLNWNGLKSLPMQIEELKDLQFLSIGWNKLEILPEQIIYLKNLRSLLLAKNELKSLPSQILGLKNLKSLDLTGNPMTVAYIEQLRKDMPWCEIEF